MNKKVSIIIPTYNMERYLRQCLDSVCNQSYSEIEILIVIDGAADRSDEIALQYALRDERVQVILQKNAGSGPARNAGLTASCGEYIVFVDPDDWVEKDMISDFIRLSEKFNPDLILSKATDITFDKKGNLLYQKQEINPHKEEFISGKTNIQKKFSFFSNNGFISSPTHKLYKKEIILANHVDFPALRRSQDIVFNYRYYEYITSVYFTAKQYYNYRIIATENTIKIPTDYYTTALRIYREIIEMFGRWNHEVTQEEIIAFSNSFLSRISQNIESDIIRHISIDTILNCSEIRKIIQTSCPDKSYLKIEKFFILHRQKKILTAYIRWKEIYKKTRLTVRTIQFRIKHG